MTGNLRDDVIVVVIEIIDQLSSEELLVVLQENPEWLPKASGVSVSDVLAGSVTIEKVIWMRLAEYIENGIYDTQRY